MRRRPSDTVVVTEQICRTVYDGMAEYWAMDHAWEDTGAGLRESLRTALEDALLPVLDGKHGGRKPAHLPNPEVKDSL